MYVGYVTAYFPPGLKGGQMTELFHVEYDNGNGKIWTGHIWPRLLLRLRLAV